jgi:hypothetical protein
VTAPAKTVIKFGSDPAGAIVARRDTGEVLGTTPFEATLPSGKDGVEFIFRKANFEDTAMQVVPEGPVAHLAVKLIEHRAPPPPVEPPPVAKIPAAKSHSRSSGAKTTTKVKTPRPVDDEDGVMTPTFK